MSYDKNNIFAKILRGEIPCKKVYENDHVLAFHDINPQKKVHVLAQTHEFAHARARFPAQARWYQPTA